MNQHAPEHDTAAEPDRPPSLKLLVLLVVLSGVVALAVVGLWQLFTLATIAQVYESELAPENPQLLDLRARDDGRLRSYDVVDPKAGRYQIPVEQAMRLLVAHPELLSARKAPESKEGSPQP